ncbi:MAG TPA: hypothetical protein VKT80_12500 [Chloroflexota bacterium]|nr:hypothetical protein [Chloroflexota bacterium]
MIGRVVIRGDQLGGYGLYFSAGVIVDGVPVTALLSRVWVSRASLLLWVILWVLIAGAVVTSQVIVRRTFVEVTSNEIDRVVEMLRRLGVPIQPGQVTIAVVNEQPRA